MKKIFLKILILVFLLFLYVCMSVNSYSSIVCSNIANNVFRLHVIANSDSYDDQNLKLLVRDEVLKYAKTISKNVTSKTDMINLIKNNLNQIEKIANNTIKQNGYNYPVKISIGIFPFPKKSYGDITLPSGLYDALKIEIGEAKGKNWWCVMFPPLCFIDVSSGIVPDESKSFLKENLSKEEFDFVSSNNIETKFKFKLVELLQNVNINDIFI